MEAQVNAGKKRQQQNVQLLLVSGGRCHLLVVLQEPLKGLFGLLVFNSGLLFFLFLRLDLVSIERLFLLTQFGKSTFLT